MDQKTVRKLERELEKVVAEVIERQALEGLPLLPSQQTIHFTSKATVAVYEAAVEANDQRNQPDDEVRG